MQARVPPDLDFTCRFSRTLQEQSVRIEKQHTSCFNIQYRN